MTEGLTPEQKLQLVIEDSIRKEIKQRRIQKHKDEARLWRPTTFEGVDLVDPQVEEELAALRNKHKPDSEEFAALKQYLMATALMGRSRNEYFLKAMEIIKKLEQQNRLRLAAFPSAKLRHKHKHVGMSIAAHPVDNRFRFILHLDSTSMSEHLDPAAVAIRIVHEAQHLRDFEAIEKSLLAKATPLPDDLVKYIDSVPGRTVDLESKAYRETAESYIQFVGFTERVTSDATINGHTSAYIQSGCNIRHPKWLQHVKQSINGFNGLTERRIGAVLW